MVDMGQKHTQRRWNLWVLVVLSTIVFFGFLLRSYHFSDWLHFELDQSRDARVIDRAMVGSFFDLPLLGPKAGGTLLRLGPSFYMFQYVSGLLFGANPVGYALGVMMLSVATIGVFFLFVRRFFTDRLSLSLTALLATSLFFVLYGRFAWNPNPIPFFVLSGFYALLRSVDAHEKHRGVWFGACVMLFSIASQLHFLAFISLPILLVSFLLIRRPRYSWKAWLAALGIVAFLYLPVVLNEMETGGRNSQEFVKAITDKSTNAKYSILEKTIRNTSEHSLAALVVVTGFEGGMFPAIRVEDGTFITHCLTRCDAGKWYGLAAILTFSFSIFILLFLWWRERERTKADFLLLSGLWLGITFVLFLPLAYSIAPRFFLLSGPFFIVLVGVLLLMIERCFRRYHVGFTLSISVIVLLVGSNVFFTWHRFDELSRSMTEAIDSEPDRILKEQIRVTLQQEQAIVDFLTARSHETGYPVYMWSEPQYRRALKYLLEQRGVENAVLGFDGIYRQGVYYLVLRAHSNHEDALKKYRPMYTVGEKTFFGTLIVFELFPKPEFILMEHQDFSREKPQTTSVSPRYTWREWYSRNWSQQSVDRMDTSDDASGGVDNEIFDGL